MSKIPLWHELTVLFGGAFDPPHIGHRQAVRGLFKNPGVKEVWVIPSGTPPMKSSDTSPAVRLELTRINFSAALSDRRFPTEVRIDTREIDPVIQRLSKKPSYTYDTLLNIKREVPNLAFAVGSDQLAQFSKWHRFPEILGLCHWIFLKRKPLGEEEVVAWVKEARASNLIQPSRGPGSSPSLWQLLDGKTYLNVVETDAPLSSSTDVRIEIEKHGKIPEGMLLPEVAEYLMKEHLYGT